MRSRVWRFVEAGGRDVQPGETEKPEVKAKGETTIEKQLTK